MRSTGLVTLLLGALLVGPAVSAAPALAPGDTLSTIILNANFDSDAIGLPPDVTLPGPPPGDYLTLDATGGAIYVDASVDGLSKPVVLRQDNAAGLVSLSAWGAVAPARVENVVARWRTVAHDDNPDDILETSVRAASGARLATVVHNPHGVLTYNGPAGTGILLPVTYTNNKNNQFTVTIDFVSRTTSLSVDGVALSGAQNVPFLEPGDDFARIQFAMGAPHPQSFAIDDISAVAFTRIPDQAPVVTAPATAAGAESALLTFTVSASDPDGDAITGLAAAPLPSGATFTPGAANTSGTFAWTPAYGQAGSYSVTFTASNALSGTAATAITISHTDRAPIVTAPDVVDGEIGGTLIFTVTASDPDGEAITSLTADLSLLPAGNDATFVPGASNASGVFTWHMQPGQGGSFPVTFTASNALSATAYTRINVAAPGTSITGDLVWTPQPGDEGVYDIVFTAMDQAGLTASATTQLTILAGPSAAAPLAAAGSAPLPAPGGRDAKAPLAPAMPQKGPVISAPTTTRGYIGDAVTVTATACETGGSLAPRLIVTRAAGTASAPGQATGPAAAAQSLTLTADLSVLPSGNDAVFTVDHDPIVTAPATVYAEVETPLSFTVTATDPDVQPIYSFTADPTGLPAGNGAAFTSDASNTSGTFTWTPALADSGNYAVTFTAANALVGQASTSIHVRGVALASAYCLSKKIQLSSNKPSVSFVVQPVGSSFSLTDIVLSTVALVSSGTGSVSRIYTAGKAAVIGDRNGDLIPDLTVSFAKGDLRLLFSLLRGTVTVPVRIEGQLLGGRHFMAPLSVTVVAGGGALQASVAPNPLNPSATLTFYTRTAGPVRARLYDMSGRLVRELLSESMAPAGEHAVAVDGRDRFGRPLASGVYFYRIEAADGISNGRLAVVK